MSAESVPASALEEQAEIDSFLATHGKKFGNDVKKTDQTGHTLLHTAVVNGDFVAAKYCVSKGADVNAKTTNHGLAPLHMAAVNGLTEDNSGAIEIIRFLASKGADVNAKNNDGDTPIEFARKKSREWGGNDNLDKVVECLSSISGR